ncbi:HlyD family secretion protein [Salinarimonas soli]|uniref:HlyD family secretion protein n=1 Tax=Salinarimonas soli TaxID=1638099 RepID=A0A5B2VDY2_9HYPH|nr:HlyD family secretion protein [Salinarimonas soli]KAA2236569.1 HlyD family secretion protein [Salinarimonas soli]
MLAETDLAPSPARPSDPAAPPEARPPAARPADPAPAAKPRRRLGRILLVLGPLVLVAGALWLYLSGGRYVSEEDSYVQIANVAVNAQVAGQVVRVAVHENQAVQAGDLLFEIDPAPYRIALDGAKAQLGVVQNQLRALIEDYGAKQSDVAQAQATLTYAQAQLKRVQDLAGRQFAAQASLDAAQRDTRVAQDTLQAAQNAMQSISAQLGGNPRRPVEQQAQYLQARAQVAAAERNLGLARATAPFAGIVTQVDNLQVGGFLNPGQVAFNLVSSDRIWVEANIRETDLTYMKVGDPATLVVDAYPGVTFRARVATLSPASGAIFALLPPQNATGNFVKVVQRVPVRLDVEQPAGGPVLRAGMSATVSIDTGHVRSLRGLWEGLLATIGVTP